MDLDFQTNHVKCKAKDIIMIQSSNINIKITISENYSEEKT